MGAGWNFLQVDICRGRAAASGGLKRRGALHPPSLKLQRTRAAALRSYKEREDMKYLSNVVTLELDVQKCTGCGMCVVVCPHAVFALPGANAVIEDRDACMECGACARNCPADAISVDSGVGCASGMLNSMLGVKGGCCNEDQSCCCESKGSCESLRPLALLRVLK